LLISVACSEITIKGGNRRRFENLLIRNMRLALSGCGPLSIERASGRMILSSDSGENEKARSAIMRTFGVDLVSFPASCEPEIGRIREAALALMGRLRGKAIRVDTKRSDKRFPMTSQEVNRLVGKDLVDGGCTVDLDHPDETVHIEILQKRALVYLDRLRGPGGLPLGSSGKVLSLLSGGIDSPVSSWLMMKRGCVTDLLHVHQPGLRPADSKIYRLVKSLRDYSPLPMRLFSVPYTEFYKKSLAADARSELVLFRRFLFRLGCRIASANKLKGLVTGDSVGQVASQTLDNIMVSDEAASLPVFRPLAGFNKQEIVDLAIRIGTYKTSIEPYKDCCSLVAHKNPMISVPLSLVKKTEEELDMDSIVERSIGQMEISEI
jgi:thiamine biosynthesis protein ThiI